LVKDNFSLTWNLCWTINIYRTILFCKKYLWKINIGIYLKLPYSITSQHLGQRWSPLLKDDGYNNVLPGQDYDTLQGALIDGYGVMVKWWLAGENWTNSQKNMYKCHLVSQKCDMESHRIEPVAPRWEASTNHLSSGTGRHLISDFWFKRILIRWICDDIHHRSSGVSTTWCLYWICVCSKWMVTYTCCLGQHIHELQCCSDHITRTLLCN
jgi:hypothetical protein